MGELPQKLHAVVGERFEITCTATNDQDAPMNLKFSWSGPNSVQSISMTDVIEDDGLTATSTLHINNVTHNHDGVYQCTVSNGEHPRNNISVASSLVVESKISVHLLHTGIHTAICCRKIIATYKV